MILILESFARLVSMGQGFVQRRSSPRIREKSEGIPKHATRRASLVECQGSSASARYWLLLRGKNGFSHGESG